MCASFAHPVSGWEEKSCPRGSCYFACLSLCTHSPGKHWITTGNSSYINFRAIGKYSDQIFDENVTTVDAWADDCITLFRCAMILRSTEHVDCTRSKFASHFTEVFIWTLWTVCRGLFKQCVETLDEFIVITEWRHLSQFEGCIVAYMDG